jgi:hypothetical protein
VAKDADGSDLILIVHGWVSSSFNRYYTLATEQVDFPAPGRVGATPFDHVARRVGDPAALASAERRLDASRAAGHRVWLVFDATSAPCIGATCGSARVDPADGDGMAVLRASQLRAYVAKLYGAPTSCDASSSLPPRDEELGVCLFAPH